MRGDYKEPISFRKNALMSDWYDTFCSLAFFLKYKMMSLSSLSVVGIFLGS